MKLRYAIATAALILVGCGSPPETAQLQRTAVISNTQAVFATPSTATTTAPSNPSPTLVIGTPQSVQAPDQTVTNVTTTQSAPTVPPTPMPNTPTTAAATMAVPTTPPSSPTPAPSARTPARTITLVEPQDGAHVTTNQLLVRGSTSYWPFEASLAAQVKDATGHLIGGGPVKVQGQQRSDGTYGGGPFQALITFTPPRAAQSGTIEVFEASAKDGSIVAIARRALQFMGDQTTGAPITLDAPTAAVSPLPLHVAFHGANGNEVVRARLHFGNGSTMEDHTTAVQGFGIMNMQWNTESAPPILAGPATLELLHSDGTVAAQQAVTILGQADTRQVRVAWLGGGDVVLATQSIVPTSLIGTATLNELLWGPADGNLAGFTTQIPGVAQIINDPTRDASWGYRVRLIKLTITDGVATANFSRELHAYAPGTAGSSLRAALIRKQIEQTLLQFPSVKQVVIQIEGQNALKP